MKKASFFSVTAFVVLVVAAFWLIERPSRTQPSSNSEAAQQVSANNWVVVTEAVPDRLRDLQFLDENQGWAITEHSVWKTHDGGLSWTEMRRASAVKLLKEFAPQETLERIQFVSENEGWIVEGSSLLHTENGGLSWKTHKPDGVTVRSVRFLNRENGWLVGQLLRLPSRGGEMETWHPVIYGTKDAGKTWRRVYLGPEDRYPLWEIWPASHTNVWAVGSSFLHSVDGGATWNSVLVKYGQGVSGMPIEVRFLDSDVGWVKTNEGGGYLLTKDGGKTWGPRPVLVGVRDLADVFYVSPNEAWCVSGDIYHTTDSGVTWTKEADGHFLKLRYLKQARILIAAGRTIAKRKHS